MKKLSNQAHVLAVEIALLGGAMVHTKKGIEPQFKDQIEDQSSNHLAEIIKKSCPGLGILPEALSLSLRRIPENWLLGIIQKVWLCCRLLYSSK